MVTITLTDGTELSAVWYAERGGMLTICLTDGLDVLEAAQAFGVPERVERLSMAGDITETIEGYTRLITLNDLRPTGGLIIILRREPHE